MTCLLYSHKNIVRTLKIKLILNPNVPRFKTIKHFNGFEKVNRRVNGFLL